MTEREPIGPGPTRGPPPPPIPHDGRAALPPPFCLALIGLSVAVFLLQGFGGLLTVTRLPDGQEVPLSPLALFGPLVQDGQWWRVLTTVVEHGGVLHLVLNMSVVWTLGTGLERQLGTARFAVVSLAAALASSAFVLLLDFAQPTVGASGMILGWAGMLLPLADREARQSLVTWLVQVAIISFLPFVSWSGHLGGFLAGLLAGLALRRGPGFFRLAAPLLVLATALAVVAATRLGGLR